MEEKNIEEEKKNLREQMRNVLKLVPCAAMEQASQKAREEVRRYLAVLPGFPKLKVASFAAHLKELDLLPLVDDLKEVEWYFPKCISPREMVFLRVIDPLRDLETGYIGIREPLETLERVLPEELDVVLVPGLAFSQRGGRLGKGGGFYDAYLTKVRGRKVGVTTRQQMVPFIPEDGHDQAVDAVIAV